MPIDPSRTVAELVLEQPSRARVFEELGLDYCCGGKRSLTVACGLQGVDADHALAALEAAGDAPTSERDWTGAPLTELCDHIVGVHHDRLRVELPRLDGLVDKVARAHAAERPARRAARRVHRATHRARGAPRDRGAGAVPARPRRRPLRPRPGCRPRARPRLGRLRARAPPRVGGRYDLDRALCNSHRALLDGLHDLERDLHQHIHEENNVLFPRALAAA